MRFREWLLTESSDRVVLMKTVNDEGSDSIGKVGFQLQDKHRSTAGYYKKYGDTSSDQMYGPGLYFTVVPAGQDPNEFARKNCKAYSQWGNHVVLATIKPGSRGLVTGFQPGHPMWKYVASKDAYVYDQLEALGVNDLIKYGRNDVHTENEWGYKLHDKIDFWAHSHWAEGGMAKLNVVVYNPSVLQMIGSMECEVGQKRPSVAMGSPRTAPNDKSPQTLRPRNSGMVPSRGQQPPSVPRVNLAPQGDEDLSLEPLD